MSEGLAFIRVHWVVLVGQVVSFVLRNQFCPAKRDMPVIDLPDFEYMFLSNLIVRLGDQGFASLARAISDSAANLERSGKDRVELDGLVDLGLTFLTPASGTAR